VIYRSESSSRWASDDWPLSGQATLRTGARIPTFLCFRYKRLIVSETCFLLGFRRASSVELSYNPLLLREKARRHITKNSLISNCIPPGTYKCHRGLVGKFCREVVRTMLIR